ncbi:RNA polymerase sigma factor [soil metagenome]
MEHMPCGPMSDEEAVRRVLGGETILFEVLMRRYNQRIYRAALSITRNEGQAEEIMQAAYVNAYEHLAQFSGKGPFGAWLTRIAINEAFRLLRSSSRFIEQDAEGRGMDVFAAKGMDPEQAAMNAEAARLLERLIGELPDVSRAVFVLREVEGMSTAEVSHALTLTEDNVKVRLHRARAALREALDAHAARGMQRVYAFDAVRCDAVVAGVFAYLNLGWKD